MNEKRARKLLANHIQPDNGLLLYGHYIGWSPSDKTAVLDSEFTVEELEAVVWWMKNKNTWK